jgi:hypothetical protein
MGALAVRPYALLFVPDGVQILLSAQIKVTGNLTIRGGAGSALVGDGTTRMFHVLSSLTLETLTLLNGIASDSSYGGAFGGACFITGGSVWLRGCNISGCSVSGASLFLGATGAYGGAIAVVRGSVFLTGCHIGGCTAIGSMAGSSAFGSVLAVGQGNAWFYECSISGCMARSPGYTTGGAMFIYSDSLRLSRCKFIGCMAAGLNAYGGALALGSYGSGWLDGCIMSGCISNGTSAAYGGAINIDRQTAWLSNSTISACIASSAAGSATGGGVCVSSGGARLSRCTTAKGPVAAFGGLLRVSSGSVQLLDGTRLFDGSTISPTSATGQLVSTESGTVTYLLPAPLGFWLPATLCQKIFNACPVSNINGCNRTALGVAPLQQCNWQNKPELLGKVTHTLPVGPINDIEYPFRCPSGTYGADLCTGSQDSATCTGRCPPGYVCPSPATTRPLPCSRGHFCETGAAVEQPCPSGSHQPAEGQEECIACDEGHACPTGSINQTMCSEGTYAPAASGSCLNCPQGKYNQGYGHGKCLSCQQAHWCTAGKIIRCPANTFNQDHDASSQAACNECPLHSITVSELGGVNATSCVCEAGYYNTGYYNGEPHCEVCPLGTICTRKGVNLQELSVAVGYYRALSHSDNTRRCPDAESEHSGCRGGSNVLEQCAERLDGIYCTQCSEEYSNGYYYEAANSRETATCKPCSSTTGVIVAILLVGCAFAAIAALTWRYVRHSSLIECVRAFMAAFRKQSQADYRLPPVGNGRLSGIPYHTTIARSQPS